MKRIFLLFILIIAASNAFAKVNIIVSIAPQKAYVDAIGGDLVNTTLLVPIGSNPNFYEPKSIQMKAVSKADVYFTIGGHFEKAWLPRIKDQNKKMEIFNCSTGIERIPMKFKKKGKKMGSKDIHVWTTPNNISQIGKNIYETLVRYDSANKEYYKKNYEAFAKKAQTTHNKIKTILNDIPNGSKFMVFHPAWGYFAKEYNLEQMPIEVEGKEPKPKELVKIIEKARVNKIKAILTQPEFSKKGATLIANELDIKVVTVSPLNPKWSKNLVRLAKIIANKE